MKLQAGMILFAAFLCMVFAGCGREDTVYLEQEDSEYVGFKEESGVSESEEPEAIEELCCVYICGAVVNPGVYEVASGSRIYEVVVQAGGLTEEADVAAVNQAEIVSDGQMIYLPAAGEGSAEDGRVNINTASVEELMTLSGIGQAKAEQIVTYRDANGSFSSGEEIMNVDGIKEGLYNRIKDNIRVN